MRSHWRRPAWPRNAPATIGRFVVALREGDRALARVRCRGDVATEAWIEVGSYVRHDSGWFGRVLEVGTTTGRYVYTFAVVHLLATRDGRPYRKGEIMRTHPHWLSNVDAVPYREGAWPA